MTTPTKVSSQHAHVYSPAGSEIGTALNIMSWDNDEILDESGSWRLDCWADANNTSLLTEGRRVDMYATLEGTETLFSSGAISNVQLVHENNVTTWSIEGRDRMAELSDRVIIGLNVCDLAWTYIATAGGVRWIDSMDAAAERNLPEAYDGTMATFNAVNFRLGDHWWLYVGYASPFTAAEYTFKAFGTGGSHNHQYQYYSPTGWTNLPDLIDGTAVAPNEILQQNGTMTWTKPTDWTRNTPTATSGSWYWMRIRTDSAAEGHTINDVQLYEIRIYAESPTTNGLNLIMAYAPSGWKTSGYPVTAGSAYGAITDYTVLQSLGWLRDQIGGHFRSSLSAGTMQIDWLSSFASSNITAEGEPTI